MIKPSIMLNQTKEAIALENDKFGDINILFSEKDDHEDFVIMADFIFKLLSNHKEAK